jgi:hypothetical protein
MDIFTVWRVQRLDILYLDPGRRFIVAVTNWERPLADRQRPRRTAPRPRAHLSLSISACRSGNQLKFPEWEVFLCADVLAATSSFQLLIGRSRWASKKRLDLFFADLALLLDIARFPGPLRLKLQHLT